MQHKTIPFSDTGFFSKTVIDYLNQDEKLAPFYTNFPNLDGFKKQLEEKRLSVGTASRTILVEALKSQYKNTSISEKSKTNIELLASKNTFTVTTGHQLNLFTGPLYFLYKIVSAINLAKQLKEAFPKDNFVPIYWMATEDHDFEEIQFFNFKGKKLTWNKACSGAVGRTTTKNLEFVYEEFSALVGNSENAKKLKKLFIKSYIEHDSLTEATRYLANELFGEYGLVIVDGDDVNLKRQFLPFVKEELYKNVSFTEVSKTIAELEKNYKIQVNPREINLFYLSDGLRERIIFENDVFKVHNTDIEFSNDELEYELKLHPDRFSPNVIMRPLYQEVILPNLCYIGGGGELAYWFELKNYFEAVKVPFPILLLRNSVLLISDKQQQKLDKLNVTSDELFLKQQELVTNKIKEISTIEFDFSKQRLFLEKQFEDLERIATQTDRSFIGAVKAQQKKQLNGLDNLEKRLLKAEKRKHQELAERIETLQDELFPNQSLEERQRNFSDYYLEHGDQLIVKLLENLNPLKGEFSIIDF
jgi:bacillithiol biosynthesis cysteine-adding enzyme BshC